MKKSIVLLLLLTSFALSAQIKSNPITGTIKSGLKPIETVEKKSKDEIVIPFKKYKLPNGMTILLHEDHSDPVIYIDITYHVGSDREQEGRSGFAHFFEHMMFQGSKHVGDEQHFKMVTEAGGTMNGTTNTDRTNYFEVLPSNQLELALWLESDRMGFLLDSVTQQKFEVQRGTVKNERGQRYDNAPYGLVQEKIGEALYPQGHPYSWSTIGYIEDLNRVDVNDLKRFYLRWYGPNNATITLAGDIDPETALALIEKYFGPIPAGPEVKPMTPTPGVLTENRYISYEDNIKFPQVNLVWPTVPAYSTESMALNALTDAFAGGKSSLFQLNFIKTKKAVQANAFHVERELAGMLVMQVRGNKDDTLSKVEKKIEQVMLEFEKKGMTEDELTQFKNSTKSGVISSLSTVSGKGSILAAYQTLARDPNFIKKQLDALAKLTPKDVMDVYLKYIKGRAHVVISVVPKGKPELRVREDNWRMYQRNIQQESAEYKNLTYTPLKETFDRSKKPAAGMAPIVNVPQYWQDKFENGIRFIGTETDEVPKVSIQVSTSAGHRFETPDKAGLAFLTADMLNESTQNYTPEQLSDKLDALGSSIDVSCNSTELNVSISSLTENLDKTLVLAEEIMFHPKFTQEDFDRCKKQQLDAIQQQQTNAGNLADQAFTRLLYGQGNNAGIPVIGTTATVEKLTLEDVKAYYQKNFSPSMTKVMVVGNLGQQQVMPKLKFLGTWKDIKVEKPQEPAVPAINKTAIYFVDKKNAPQSEIRIGCMALPYDALGEFYRSTITNFPFGGSFNSRVNLLLREKRNFTYGARGSFNGGYFDGNYVMNAAVRANATDSAVVDFMSEMKKYADGGMTPEELAFTKSSITSGEALKYESPFQKAGFLKRLLDYNLDGTYVKKQNALLQSISLGELNALAKKRLPYNNVNIVIVGDKQIYLEKVKKLGYDVKLLDTNGNEVKE